MKYKMKSHPKWSDEQLIELARPFKHRSVFKHGAKGAYDAAWRRGLLDKCCAHMEPMASPYGRDYEIYAYEFTDKHVYVGLTFLPRARSVQHQIRGPVALHAKLCATFTRKALQTGLTRVEAPAAERSWIKNYDVEGWTLLNKNAGGCTGTVRGRKWTKEAVLAEALKYQTKQEWIDSSQMSYRVAKREGWFAEASAHMPRRVLGLGLGRKVSQATRQKQREAKLGKLQSAEAKAAKSEAIKKWWVARKTGSYRA